MRPEPHANDNQESTAQPRSLPPLCVSVQARLFAYLDGDLPPSELEALRLHLVDCAACRREEFLCRQSEQALTSALSAMPPAGDLRAGFTARLAASNRVPPLWQRWRVALPALAAAGIAAFFLWHVPSRSPVADRSVAPVAPAPTMREDRMARSQAAPLSVLPPKPGKAETPPRLARGEGKSAPALAVPVRTRFRFRRRPVQQTRYRMAALMQHPARPVSVRPPTLLASAETSAASAKSTEAERSLAQMSREALPEQITPLALALQEEARPSDAAASRLRRSGPIGTARTLKTASLSGNRASASPPSEEVSVHIVDEVRGFTATTELKTASVAPDGDEVITIEADSASR